MTPGTIAIMFVCFAAGTALGWALRRERQDRRVQISVERARQQLAAQQETIEQLTRQREQLREARQQLSDQHHRSQRQISVLRETLDEANARVRSQSKYIETAKSAFETLKEQHRNTRKQLKLVIRRTQNNRSPQKKNKRQSVHSGIQAIRGIGPALARRLETHGIRTLQDLAAMREQDIDALDQKLKFPGRIRRDRWVEQAREIVGDPANNAA
ncbi:MAG: helix-hairpin-helix domain-containing protein [Pseudomonadota bacterium]